MLLRDGLASDVFSIVILSIVHLIVHLIPRANAQATTTAMCGQGFDWMNNQQGQPPCLVASILQAACGTGAWNVPALPRTHYGRQQTYLAPNATNANVCTCSAAVYNSMSACAACQEGQWLSFSQWGSFCDSEGFLTLPNSFPSNVAVPGGTTIPKYAATDPRTWSDGGFNVTEAKAIALDDPVPPFVSFCSGIASTATNVPGAPSSTSGHAAPTNSDLSPALMSTFRKTDNTGPIVGGVVGGLLGLALISVLLVWLLCGERIRHRRQRHASKNVDGTVTPEKLNILEHAFTTPSAPPPPFGPLNPPTLAPPPANIVVPVAVRPPPVSRDFPSYTSEASTLIMNGSANASNDNHAQMPSHVQKPTVTPIASVPMVAQTTVPTSESMESAVPMNRTLLQRLVRSVGWRKHTLGNTDGGKGNGTIMAPIDLLSNTASGNTSGGANGTTSGSIRVSGTSRRSRRGTRSGSYSGGGGGIVLGEQDRHILPNMSQHEANRLMANPVPFIFPSRPSSQAYDGMDLANRQNRDGQHIQNNSNQNGQADPTNPNGHANGEYPANGGRNGNRGSYGLSAAEEKRRLQKSMGRNVNANVSPPRYTSEAFLPLSSTPGQETGHELTPLRREPSQGSGSLGATLGSQSQVNLPSEEAARYEHHENLSPSPTNLISTPNAAMPPYSPNSIDPPHSPVSPLSPQSPNSFTRQSSFVDANNGTVDTSTRNRRRFTVTNPSHNVEM